MKNDLIRCLFVLVGLLEIYSSIVNLKRADTNEQRKKWKILLIIWIAHTIIWTIYSICMIYKYFG